MIQQSKFDASMRIGLVTAIFLDVSILALFRQSRFNSNSKIILACAYFSSGGKCILENR
jgi:hypothetical protein